MILEGIAIAPRWSAASVPTIGVVVELFVLEFLGQAEAIFHLVFGVLVEGARAVEDLLVLLIVVALGARLIDGSDEVVWLVAAILTWLGSFWPITATVSVKAAVVVAAIVVAANVVLSVVIVVVVAAKRAISARIFIKTYLRFLSVGVLVGGCDHLARCRYVAFC